MEPTSSPPKLLETIAGLLLPRAVREQVLGDLHERYSSPLQYTLEVICTVPWVMASRIWRGLKQPILSDGERAMFKFAATFLVLGLFIALSTEMAADGFFTPDGRFDLATTLEVVLFHSAVILVLLRIIWWSSNRAFDNLYWPTAIVASAVMLRGIVMVLSTAWSGRQSGDMDVFLIPAGGFIVLIGLLMTYTLWRTKPPSQSSPTTESITS